MAGRRVRLDGTCVGWQGLFDYQLHARSTAYIAQSIKAGSRLHGLLFTHL